MRSLAICLALPFVAGAVELLDFAPLEVRQQPGTPRYACHEDCGMFATLYPDPSASFLTVPQPGTVISLSKMDGFCTNDKFKQSLTECLDCALEFDIWKHYQSSVTKAAEACGLNATPKPASATSSPSSSSTTAQPSSDQATSTMPPMTTSTGTDLPTVPAGMPSGSPSSSENSTVPSATSATPPPAQSTGGAGHISAARWGAGVLLLTWAALL
ncbi:hypothetical protein FQN49_006925 [Arthroderma sp. PD_2]|nr:hypothetical protein FQN49_006925 [Arthroderma sp. PD_2]